MFSIFFGGIKQIIPDRIIDLQELADYVSSGFNQDLINLIRSKRKSGDVGYKNLKKKLPYITPQCILKKRNLGSPEDISKNICQFSNYIYLDIDSIPLGETLESYKKYIINRYRNQVSLVCYSASMQGLSILVKIKNKVNIENFNQIRDFVIKEIFGDELIDQNASGIGRALYLSNDNEIFVNYSNKIEVPKIYLENNTWVIDHISRGVEYNNIVNYHPTLQPKQRRIYSYKVFMSVLIFETQYETSNPILDFKEIDYLKVYPPLKIKDGIKHSVYAGIISKLFHLNPDIEEDYIYSYLFYINNTRAKPKMENRELERFFRFMMNNIKVGSVSQIKFSKKRVHFNKKAGLPTKLKVDIAKRINSAFRRYKTRMKIEEAVLYLESISLSPTYKKIGKLIKMDPKTVSKRINEPIVDIKQEVININEEFKFYFNNS